MNRQDLFITVAAIASVLGFAALTITGLHQYRVDHARFMNTTTVTNDHVTNFPWSLLPEDKK